MSTLAQFLGIEPGQVTPELAAQLVAEPDRAARDRDRVLPGRARTQARPAAARSGKAPARRGPAGPRGTRRAPPGRARPTASPAKEQLPALTRRDPSQFRSRPVHKHRPQPAHLAVYPAEPRHCPVPPGGSASPVSSSASRSPSPRPARRPCVIPVFTVSADRHLRPYGGALLARACPPASRQLLHDPQAAAPGGPLGRLAQLGYGLTAAVADRDLDAVPSRCARPRVSWFRAAHRVPQCVAEQLANHERDVTDRRIIGFGRDQVRHQAPAGYADT